MNGTQLDFLNVLFDNLHDGILQIDRKGRVIAWNRGAERITGIRAESMIGTDCRDNPFKHLRENGDGLPEKHLPILATLRDGIRRELVVSLKHVEGFRITALARTIPILDNNNEINGSLEIFNDNRSIIAAFQQNQHTEHTMLFDPLTGIGNRSHIERMINSGLKDYHSGIEPFGILFIDIDRYKDFNDQYGHLIGDKVLRFVANTLRHNLRLTDSCGRWGGDEFVAIVHDMNCEGLAFVAEKLRSRVESGEITENRTKLKVTISIGAAMVHKGDTYQSLIQRADELMYKSKQTGRNRVTIQE